MRKLYTLLVISALYTAVLHAQPTYDDCTNAVLIPYLGCDTLTNINATTSSVSSFPFEQVPVITTPGATCNWNGDQRDVWAYFVTDGVVDDITVTIEGVGSTPINSPQVAIYRGFCLFNFLANLDCNQAALGDNSVSLTVTDLDPNEIYFIRVNDFSATATPNSGDFRVCIEEYIAEVCMIDGAVLTTNSGTLFDSGCENGDYSNNENITTQICPASIHQCIQLDILSFDVENNFDELNIYEGSGTGGSLLLSLTGSGAGNLQNIQIPTTGCVTLEFISDGSVTAPGFEIVWSTSSLPCPNPIQYCGIAQDIGTLPFVGNNLTTCGAGNTMSDSPCGNDAFLNGEEYFLAYNSPGQECIEITVNGTVNNTGIAVFNSCNMSVAECVAVASGSATSSSPFIESVNLENAGTYYIVVSSNSGCGNFNIEIDTVACPIQLPSAGFCTAAFNLSGCESGQNALPASIVLDDGGGDPNFITQGVNDGTWGGSGSQSYTFFYFQAAIDGDFGMILGSSLPNPGFVDIDFNVYGPIASEANICNYAENNQPVRSSYAAGDLDGVTGLANTHPVLGTTITDTYDGTGGPLDDFVTTLPVVAGSWYLVLINDWSGTTVDGLSVDVSTSSPGIFDNADTIVYPQDTAVCVGQPVSLAVDGGEAFSWPPSTGLSCTTCANPTATPTETTTYTVTVGTVCNVYTEEVKVTIYDLEPQPDVTICTNDDFQFDFGQDYGDDTSAVWSWTPTNGLSCTDCPNPIINPATTTTYTVTLTTPNCSFSDNFTVNVLPNLAPVYSVSDGDSLCVGESAMIGGFNTIGLNYSWSPADGLDNQFIANPTATPTQTTMYTLAVTDGTCTSFDSVLVEVFYPPTLLIQNDTTICQGQSVLLASQAPEPGSVFTWSPATGLDDPTSSNPIATPDVTTTYTVTATSGSCSITEQVTVQVNQISLDVLEDVVQICEGESADLTAVTSPASAVLTWSPAAGLSSTTANQVTATPATSQLYTATLTISGCTVTDEVLVQVDSFPTLGFNVQIPSQGFFEAQPDTVEICAGTFIFGTADAFDGNLYPNLTTTWSPTTGLVSDPNDPSAVFQPTETTTYVRTTSNGGCDTLYSLTVVVIGAGDLQVSASDEALCGSAPVTLAAVGVSNVTWSASPADATLTGTNDLTTVVTPTQTTTYTASSTFAGCTITESVTVQVSTPVATTTTQTAVCGGEAAVIGNAGITPDSFVWVADPVDATLVDSTSLTLTVSPSQTTVYTLLAFNGACVDTANYEVAVVATPVLTLSADATDICAGGTVQLNGMADDPTTTVTLLPDPTLSATGVATPIVTTTYYATATTQVGGCTVTDSITINVSQPPVYELLDASLRTVCVGEQVTLGTLEDPGTTYSWVAVPNDPSLTNANSGTPQAAPGQTTVYTLTATSGSCTEVVDITITVVDPGVSATSSLPLICAGSAVTLQANPVQSGGTVEWTDQDGNVLSSDLTFDANPLATTTYTATYTLGTCVSTASVVVEVEDDLTVSIDASPAAQIDAGESVDLTAVVNSSSSTLTYAWSEGSSSATISVSPTVSTTYSVTVTSAAGCSGVATIDIVVIQPEATEVPNVFSPNGDDLNDRFAPIFAANVQMIRFQVFNRWGNKVHDNPTIGWDGTVDGAEAESDVYMYYIELQYPDGRIEVLQGDVTLVR